MFLSGAVIFLIHRLFVVWDLRVSSYASMLGEASPTEDLLALLTLSGALIDTARLTSILVLRGYVLDPFWNLFCGLHTMQRSFVCVELSASLGLAA